MCAGLAFRWLKILNPRTMGRSDLIGMRGRGV